jgi:hypothetical protein
MKKTLVGAAVCAVLILGSGGAAFAGEVNGNGDPTRGGDNARSACVYSGLEDGAEDPTAPSGPGVVQNWGHAKNATGPITAESVRGAAEVLVTVQSPEGSFTFTWGCNPHVGGEP